MAIISKACKPDNFESLNCLKLSLTNIRGLCLNFVDCKSFLESNFPDLLALCETNLDDKLDFGNFSERGYFPLIRKNSTTHMHPCYCSLCERRTSSCTGPISRKLCFQLALLHSVSYFFFLYLSTFFTFMHGF